MTLRRAALSEPPATLAGICDSRGLPPRIVATAALPSFNRYPPLIYSARHAKPGETDMATLQNFDAEIAKTKQVVEEMRSKIEQSGTVLDTIAHTDQKIGAADFDIENA